MQTVKTTNLCGDINGSDAVLLEASLAYVVALCRVHSVKPEINVKSRLRDELIPNSFTTDAMSYPRMAGYISVMMLCS